MFKNPLIKKHIICSITIIFSWFALFGSAAQTYAQQASKTVAVLDIEAKGGITSSEAGTLSDRLRTELVDLNVHTVLERGQMEAILSEQGFNQSGCTSSECIVEAGRLLGVQQMIAGDVGKLGNVLTIDIRVFDVSTGKIVRVHKQDYKGEISGLLPIMRIIARDLAGLKPVKKKSKTWLYLTLGAVAVGGAAAVILGGSSDGGENPETDLADPNWPPGN